MAASCGVVRDETGLSTLLSSIDTLEEQHGSARAMVAARLIASSALARQESRGGHFRFDFPETLPDATRQFVATNPELCETVSE